MDRERRASLLQGKLRVITATEVTDRAASDAMTPVPYFGGAALFDPITAQLFVLVEASTEDRDPLDVDPLGPRPQRGWLGGAIVAATRISAAKLHLYADGHVLNPDDARRAARCSIPTRCWSVVGRDAKIIDPIKASAPATSEDLPADEQQFIATIENNGALAVVENGVLRAEVLGLEVGRVVREAETDRPHLEVGVGKHDRLAQSMMNSSADPGKTLREAVETVTKLRVPGAPSHPATTASRSRWLREMVIAQPDRFALETPIKRLPSTVPVDLKQSGVSALLATQQSRSVVVGCSVGVDLDAPTDLLDIAELEGCETVILLVPDDHDIPAIRTLCASLTPTLTVVTTKAPFGGAE
jgi:hypothetical protein